MFCITNATAQSFYEIMYKEIVCYGDGFGSLPEVRIENLSEIPGLMEYEMLRDLAVDNYSILSGYGYGENEDFSVLSEPPRRFSSKKAAFFADADGNVLFTSGDYAAFRYLTAQEWEEKQDTIEQYAYMYLSHEEAGALKGESVSRSADVLRIIGVMENGEIVPYAVAYATNEAVEEALHQWQEKYEKGAAYSELDAEKLLMWQSLFDRTSEAGDVQLVTIYGTNPWIGCYDRGEAVTYDGVRYADLMTLLLIGAESYQGSSAFPLENKCTLWEIIDFDVNLYYSPGYPQNGEAEPLAVSVVATCCSPMREAMSALRYVYLGTFLLVVLLIRSLRKRIEKHLCLPVQQVDDHPV